MIRKETRSKVSLVLVLALLFSMLLPVISQAATAIPLKDISDSYAQKEIQTLADSGIIAGYEDGSFQPRKSMSRAELAKIIVLSLGLKEDAEKASLFTDINKDSWYRGFVGALVESGITQGTTATTFSPEAKVTREELVVFFIRALGLADKALQLPIDNKFTDFNDVSAWAGASVSLAFKIGFVNGLDTQDGSLKFGPKENAERQALARLAFEFSTNKSLYIEKANQLTKTEAVLAVSSVTPINTTSVEVTFNQAVATIDKADFSFDNGLTVSNAEIKSGNTAVVVLTTSVQSSGAVYKLSYKSKDTSLTLTGFSSLGGGGGGGGYGSIPTINPSASAETLINQGGTFTDLTLRSSGTFGPASGTSIITGTLKLDPGVAGEITLQNIDAANIEVLSGSSNSVKLTKTKVAALKINAGSQTSKVRVQSLEGAQVVSTSVYSQVILESSAGNFGDIVLDASAANQSITLKGSFSGTLTVNAANADIQLEAPTGNPSGQTSVGKINIASNAKITMDANAVLGAVNVSAKDAKIELNGAGKIGSLTVDASAVGSTLTIGATSNVQAMQINGNVTLVGDPAKIAAIAIKLGDGAKVTASDELRKALIPLAIQAIGAIGAFSEFSIEKDKLILAADTAANTAISLGIAETEITNYSLLVTAKQAIATLKAPIVADLDKAKTSLAISFAAGDANVSVTGNLVLPLSGDNGTTVAWTSSNTAVISNDGSITRPATGQADVVLTLTATLAKKGLTVIKEFKLTVKAKGSSTIATTGSITGTVTGGDASLIAGATVTLSGTTLSAISDAKGNFTITNVPPGANYAVSAALGANVTAPSGMVNVTAGVTTSLASELVFYTWSTGDDKLAFGAYPFILAETDQFTGDFDTDQKMYVPLIVKDARGNVLSADDIVSNAGKFTIVATVGIQLATHNVGGGFSTPIAVTGANKGKIQINGVTNKGLATITIQSLDLPKVKATFSTMVGEPRKADKIAFTTEPRKYMTDGTDNEFKVKVYDQHGGEMKPTNTQNYASLYRVKLRLQANTTPNADSLVGSYGLALKSNEVFNNTAVDLPAGINKKFAFIPMGASSVTRDVYRPSVYNAATNAYDASPVDYLNPADVFDKSFKFYTNNFNGIATTGSFVNTDKKPVQTGTSYTLTAYLQNGNGAEINNVSTTLEVLNVDESKNKLTYEVYLDKGINNTILAVDDYLGGVTGATFVRAIYPKLSKEIKVRAKNSSGELVNVPQTISSISSSNPLVAGITNLPSSAAFGTGFVTGLDAGTARLSVVYKDAKGDFLTSTLDVTSKNEGPVVASIVVKNSAITANRNTLNAIAAANNLYPWDVNIGEKITIKDQFGDEIISEKAPGSKKLDTAAASTDQFIQLHQPVLNLTYYISDVQSGQGGVITINKFTGQITSIDPDVKMFTVNVLAPSGVKSSTVVTLVN